MERYLNKIDDMEISEELERAAKKIFSKRRTPALRNPLARGDDSRGTEIGRRRREGRVTSSEDLDKEIETWF